MPDHAPPRTPREIIEDMRAEAETSHVDTATADLLRQWANELTRALNGVASELIVPTPTVSFVAPDYPSLLGPERWTLPDTKP